MKILSLVTGKKRAHWPQGHLFAGVAIIVTCIVAVACGDSGSSDELLGVDSTIAGAADTVETTESTEPVTTTVPDPGYPITGTYTYDSGYVVSVTVTVWDPVASGSDSPVAHPAGSGWSLQPGVDFDPQTDCVVPGKVTMTNATPGWAIESPNLRVRLFQTGESYSQSGQVAYPTDLILNFSNGPETSSYTAYRPLGGSADAIQISYQDGDGSTYGPYITWDSPMSFDQSVSTDCFVIVRDYYSPARADGATGLLSCIELGAQAPFPDLGQITEVTGPNLESEPGNLVYVDMSLSGAGRIAGSR